MFVKIGDFIKFKGFLLEFLENMTLLRKSKTPRINLPEIADFSVASPFTMHLVWTLLDLDSLSTSVQKCKSMLG